MKQSILNLEAFVDDGTPNSFRTIIKTRHSRLIFLSLAIQNDNCTITNCFYVDRNKSRKGEERYRSKPLKLRTFQFTIDELLGVIETELDKKFYGIQYIHDEKADLPLEEYLAVQASMAEYKYRFLIMIGSGETYNGLPKSLRTRLKNNLHRSVYIELAYYKDGLGIVKQCYYYDGEYQQKDHLVTPPMLISCFFTYTRDGILKLLNEEICCSFNHMIVTEHIDLDSNKTPLCGAV